MSDPRASRPSGGFRAVAGRRCRRTAAAALGLALSGALAAQPPGHLGSQFQVNTYTTNEQVVPSVGAGPDGSFVVVWESNGSPGPDSDRTSIQARRFQADGTPLGPQ